MLGNYIFSSCTVSLLFIRALPCFKVVFLNVVIVIALFF